jgi:hypothetical protein
VGGPKAKENRVRVVRVEWEQGRPGVYRSIVEGTNGRTRGNRSVVRWIIGREVGVMTTVKCRRDSTRREDWRGLI